MNWNEVRLEVHDRGLRPAADIKYNEEIGVWTL